VDWSVVDWLWLVVNWLWGVVSWGGGDCAVNSGEVLLLFVGDFSGVLWDSIHWCWGVFVDRTLVVVMDAGLGFSDSGEVSVFSGKNFMGLLDWLWCFIVSVEVV
jgi:hypothetical protein